LQSTSQKPTATVSEAFASLPQESKEKLRGIRMLLMDVDGVLTDGRVLRCDDGRESKRFSTRDGFGLAWAKRFGLLTGVISGRSSVATEQRCKELHLDEIYLGTIAKREAFDKILSERKLKPADIAYIGDDIIDLQVMTVCGLAAAPRDAHDEVLARVDIVLDFPGGHGAVRRFIDLWLLATRQWDESMQRIMRGKF
jgi:3-deoxy-D-manno-octulosonate 8-phosphate phosphatase (KDO 8-P phosphatase)